MDRQLEKILAELEKEDWYHGCLPFEDIVSLLKKDGDFLLRELGPEGNRGAMVCLTVKTGGKVRDFPVHHLAKNDECLFTIDGTNKNSSVMTLVQFHLSTKTPVSEGIVLKHARPKKAWELTSDKITLEKKIGSGAFGEVWKGVLTEGTNKIDVAVKLTKVCAENKQIMDDMFKEARLMRQYKHKNIVSFYGIARKDANNAMIVMEFIEGGSLRGHLQQNKNISIQTKISYAIDVAVGLVYLHSKNCMHRDVACRNCLIDASENLVKISDFGLSKVADQYEIPATEKLPIRWQAPEVLRTRIYTAKCDVYSYGILVWEIFNDGETPYKGIDNKTIRLKIVDPNFRPEVDNNLPQLVHRVAKTCWRGDPKKRPTMDQVARYLIDAPPELFKPRTAVLKNGEGANPPAVKSTSLVADTGGEGTGTGNAKRFAKSYTLKGKGNTTVS
ncbi:hypothetical protein Q1695_010442 [Nippostrongylus brasiliensis]|nr:hypothetical protein Q1695_010442 [Nippostrongylus brasiliensis]